MTLSSPVLTESLPSQSGTAAEVPPYSHWTAAELALAISGGDSKAEAEFYRRYYPSLHYVLERKTGDPEAAADLCQEAFCILLERLRSEPLSDAGKVVSFLHMTGTNLHIAEVRKSVRRKTYANQSLVNQAQDPTQSQFLKLLLQRRASAVQLILESLPNARDRALLEAYYIQEKDKSEICEALDLGERHFDKVLFRAKQRFRDFVLKKPGKPE